MTDKTEAAVAAPKKPDALPEGWVMCRVTKKGADRISTGEHVVGKGDVTHPLNARFGAPKEIAAALEARDFVELV
jgi:hypothetical protein